MNKQELEKIKQKALEDHIPIIMDDTLEVIEKKLKENPPKRILEIGAAVGYSAMCFSEFLAQDGVIDTIERDEERIQEAKENFKKVGVEDKIKLYEGKNRQVKKMFESVGHPVKRLHRISVGCVNLKGLRPGEYRRLKPQEVKDLKKLVGK